MKNAFCKKMLFLKKCVFFKKMLFLEKRLDKKAIVNFKIFDVTDGTSNSYNTYIAQ